MNNPVKLLIGVVGLALLLALLVPSVAPAPEPPLAESAVPPVVPTPAAAIVSPAAEPVQMVSEPMQVEFFKFGEPTIDGKPFGSVDDEKANNNGTDRATAPVIQVASPPPAAQSVPADPPATEPEIPAGES